MNDFRTKFTKWYFRKGYRMTYKPRTCDDDIAELIFHCPWWVRPVVEFFFSPCVYYREVANDNLELEQTLLDEENNDVSGEVD